MRFTYRNIVTGAEFQSNSEITAPNLIKLGADAPLTETEPIEEPIEEKAEAEPKPAPKKAPAKKAVSAKKPVKKGAKK